MSRDPDAAAVEQANARKVGSTFTSDSVTQESVPSTEGAPLATRAGSQPWIAALLAGAIVIATVAVCLNLLFEGPFRWHFSRSAAIQGAVEVLLLWGLLHLVLSRTAASRWRLLWLALPMAVYLRRHHADAPALVSLLYLEWLLALGHLVCRASGLWQRVPGEQRWLERLLGGIAVWSLALWTLQALELGHPKAARLLFALALIPVFAIARIRPLSFSLAGTAFAGTRIERFVSAGVIAILCALFARTNVYAGHDALWYGFRPEQVLVGANSVFDSLGLVSPVYYFPKLYEVMLLPLSAMGDFSFVGGLTILLTALLVLLALRFLREYGVPRDFAALVALALLTMPALANSALMPKPDVLASLGVMAMAWHLRALQLGRGGQHFGLLLCWAGIVSVTKLNLLPYVAVLGLVGLVLMARVTRTAAASGHPCWREVAPTMVPLAIITLVGVAVTARTWIVAGVPTVAPEQLVSIWNWFGLQFRYPVGTLVWVYPQQWNDVPALLLDWLLRPARLPHIIISWAGNLWFVLGLAAGVAAIAGRARPARHAHFPLAEVSVVATGALMLLAIRYHYRGSDGNYFIAPVAFALLLGAGALARRSTGLVRDRLLQSAMLLAILFQGYYSFVSAGWSAPGTRSLDLDFARSAWDTPQTRWNELEHHGLAEVSHYLQWQTDRRWRIVGEVPEPLGFWLPARYEEIRTVLYSHPQVLDAPAQLHRFLACAKIDAVIVATSKAERTQLAELVEVLDPDIRPLRSLAEGTRFVLWDVRPLHQLQHDGHSPSPCQ